MIYKATHGISKSNEPRYRFWEHSSTVFVEIETDRNGTYLKLKKKLYSYVLKNFQGVLLILIHRALLVQLRILCVLSRQNWFNKKDIKKNHTSIESKFHVFRT